MVSLGVGGVLIQPGGLSYRFREIFCEVADVATCFLGAPEDAFDVRLRPESHDVRGLSEIRTGLIPGGQRGPGVGIGEGLARLSHTGNRSA